MHTAPMVPIVIGLVVLSSPLAGLGQAGRVTGQLALVGGTIYTTPQEAPIRDGFVLIRDGVIAAVDRRAAAKIPANIETIDCSGLTITAGFWNSHAHFFERKWADVAAIPAADLERQLQEMLTRYGFTAVFDIGSTGANTRRLRDLIESGQLPGPRIRSTGEVLVAKGAVPSDAIMRALGYMPVRNFEIADAAQAAMAARTLLDAGADGIKIHLQPPPSPAPTIPVSAIEAAVNEAHRAGKPVFVHPNTGADVVAAIRAGVDVLAHTTPSSGPWDTTILEAMKERKVALTPTLTGWKELLRHDRVSVQEQAVKTSIDQLRTWVSAGGTVLFGTDLGAVGYDPSEEYTLMVKAGMSFRQILASLTVAPAERFGVSTQLGKVVSGFTADLTVLRGDPSSDIRALANVQYTVRDGKVLYRAPR